MDLRMLYQFLEMKSMTISYSKMVYYPIYLGVTQILKENNHPLKSCLDITQSKYWKGVTHSLLSSASDFLTLTTLKLEDSTMVGMKLQMPNLQSLYFRYQPGDENWVGSLCAPALRTMMVRSFPSINEVSYQVIKELARFPLLTHFLMDFSGENGPPTGAGKASPPIKHSGLKYLTISTLALPAFELAIKSFPNITDITFENFLSFATFSRVIRNTIALHKITTFSLCYSREDIDEEDLAQVFYRMHNIRTLNLSGGTVLDSGPSSSRELLQIRAVELNRSTSRSTDVFTPILRLLSRIDDDGLPAFLPSLEVIRITSPFSENTPKLQVPIRPSGLFGVSTKLSLQVLRLLRRVEEVRRGDSLSGDSGEWSESTFSIVISDCFVVLDEGETRRRIECSELKGLKEELIDYLQIRSQYVITRKLNRRHVVHSRTSHIYCEQQQS